MNSVSSQIIKCLTDHTEGLNCSGIAKLGSMTLQQVYNGVDYLKKRNKIIKKDEKYFLNSDFFAPFIIRINIGHHIIILNTFDELIEQKKKLTESKTKFAIYTKVCEE